MARSRAVRRTAFVVLGIVLGIACWASAQQAHAPARGVTIGGGGDLLLHLRVIAAARYAERGWDEVLGALPTIVTPDEIAFANLETPLSMERPPETGSPPILGAPPEAAVALARAGIDVLSVANNHAYDQRATGLARTLAAVRAAGIGAIGAGPTAEDALAPIVIEREGLRVAFLALTDHINAGPGAQAPVSVIARWEDDARVAATVARARRDADLLVVSIHWSHDFFEHPSSGQRRRARLLAEHGADLILGHGPHVLHDVERLPSPRGEALCAYSLGNLLSNQGMRYRVRRPRVRGAHPATILPGTRDGVWLRTRLELDGGRVRVAAVEGVPLFTFNNYFARFARQTRREEIRIARLRDVADDALRDERRRAIARALGPAVTLLE